MKVMYHWLKEFTDAAASPAELRSRLAMAGIPVEGLEESPAGPVLELELFMNRPDCMGHLGVAREVAALERKRLKTPEPKPKESKEKVERATSVTIESPELCGRFTARVIRGVKVGPSPAAIRQRLEACGVAAINNLVDATNYVMLELGHPLHAFDLDRLAERRIVVRRARAGERITTLDGVERKLTPEMCVVCDAARPQGIGGVMGGAESEIGPATTNLLLECAWFDPVSIRRTAKALGLRTEASTRFERGMDPEMAERASRRAAELILELAGGELLAGVVDVYPAKAKPLKLELSRRELLRVMGADVPDREIEAILAALGFAPVRADDPATRGGKSGALTAAWECTRPPWRGDVSAEIDLVEEIARHHGFEKFPPRLPPARIPAERLDDADTLERFRERLLGLGYTEAVTIPMISAERDALFASADAAPAALGNPLAEDAGVLRRTGAASLAGAVEWNLNHGQRNVRLFEIGRTYRLDRATPAETPVLTLAATGLVRAKRVDSEEKPVEYDFAELKGDLEALGELAGGLRFAAGAPEWLDPAQAASVGTASGEVLGAAGRLARRVAERFKFRQDIFFAELALAPLVAAHAERRAALRYRPLSRFPAVERDFSLVLDDGRTFAEVEAAIRALALADLASVEAADLFRGGQVPAGKYSLLVRVVFQSHEATLTDADVNERAARIVRALESQLAATLRTT
jgi:phenylalanyl-tRNA synthetase beta chain